jgi:hypothetical protein
MECNLWHSEVGKLALGCIGRRYQMQNNLSETISKMVQSLPEALQMSAFEEFRRIIEEKRHEAEWDSQFERKKGALESAARKVKRQIKAGQVEQMDYEKL